MRIAVLDDDPVACAILRELLEHAGHGVSVYRNPWDLLTALFHSHPPLSLFDAFIVDMLLPELPGSLVIQHVRGSFAEVPIVIISGLPPERLKRLTCFTPPIAVLKKPFSLRDLLAALEPEEGSSQPFSPAALP